MFPNCKSQVLSVTPKCPYCNERKNLKKAFFFGCLIDRDVGKTK